MRRRQKGLVPITENRANDPAMIRREGDAVPRETWLAGFCCDSHLPVTSSQMWYMQDCNINSRKLKDWMKKCSKVFEISSCAATSLILL